MLIRNSTRNAAGAPGLPPVFTVNPVMTVVGGNLETGETVSCTSGTITGSPTLIEYQWEIAGVPLYKSLGVLAWDNTYVLGKGTQWKTPRCKVTATNAYGSTVAYSNDLGKVTIDFSTKTACGHAEIALGLGAVTITGGASNADFAMLAGKLIPSGTYGAQKTWARSRYALTMSDATVVNVRIVNDGATVATPSTDTRTGTNELHDALYWTGTRGLKLGENVWIRDGSYWNPANGDWYIDIPSSGYGAGSGTHVTVRSETVDYTLDADGNPNNQHGAKLGPIRTYFDATINAKIRYQDTWHSMETSPVPVAHLHAHGGANPGWGINFRNCRISVAAGVVDADTVFALRLNGGATVDYCVFDGMYHAIAPIGIAANGDFISQWNIFHGVFSDCHHMRGSNLYVRDNIAYNPRYSAGTHPDFCQHLGAPNGVTETNIVVERNIVLRNLATLNWYDFQCFFMADSVGTGRITPTIRNNITFVTSAQGVWLYSAFNPTVEFNTCLTDYNANTSDIPNQSIRIGDAVPGGGTNSTGGTYNRNVCHGYDFAAQGGTVTKTPDPNQSIGTTMTAILVAFPGMASANYNYPCNRANRLKSATPPNLAVASGGVVNPDGTVNGALFPAVAPAVIGAWNDGSVYDPSNPTWVAAHPIAA